MFLFFGSYDNIKSLRFNEIRGLLNQIIIWGLIRGIIFRLVLKL